MQPEWKKIGVLSHFKGNLTGNRRLGRSRSTWKVDVRMYLKEIGVAPRNWIDQAQDRHYYRDFTNVELNLRVS